jgi:hypothetical protein
LAWQQTGTQNFQLATINSSGAMISCTATISGTSLALESAELTFNQDLNGDGYVDTAATVINASGAAALTVNPLQQPATIQAGAVLELTGGDTSSVTFAGTTGTLKLDQATSFTGEVFNFTGDGNITSSDILDLKDIQFASATESFSGNSSSGTLTVRDGLGDTAHFLLSGNYTSSTFTLSNNGSNGTDVIDPPVAQAPTGPRIAIAGGANRTDVAGAVNVGVATAAAAQFNTASGEAVGQVYKPSFTSAAQARETTANATLLSLQSTQPVTGSADEAQPGVLADRNRDNAFALGMSPAADYADQNRPIAAVAVDREILSPRDVIRAIDDGGIAIKVSDGRGNAADRQVWLFDDAQGTFVPPKSEAFTIVLDHDQRPSPLPADHASELLATATVIVATGPAWFGVLREFGRKAVRAVQQGVRWTP